MTSHEFVTCSSLRILHARLVIGCMVCWLLWMVGMQNSFGCFCLFGISGAKFLRGRECNDPYFYGSKDRRIVVIKSLVLLKSFGVKSFRI